MNMWQERGLTHAKGCLNLISLFPHRRSLAKILQSKSERSLKQNYVNVNLFVDNKMKNLA